MQKAFEKIIERLNESTIKHKESLVFFNVCGVKFVSIGKAIEIVNQVAEEYKADWIPCSERLPEKSGEYLVTYHPCYWDSVQDGVKVGIDTFRGKTTWARNKYQKVIAWKPLPKAYEVETAERELL